MRGRRIDFLFASVLLSGFVSSQSAPSGQSAAAPGPSPVHHQAPAPPSAQSSLAKSPQPAERPTKGIVDGHLTRTDTITSPTEVAGRFLFGSVKCDGDGNVFFLSDTAGVSGIHKLNRKGERLAIFEADSNPDLKIDSAVHYALEPGGGEVYQLVFPHEINRYVFVYKSDGTFKSAVNLQPGFAFFPGKLAVFPSRQFLVSGMEYDSDKAAAMWPFTGIFAADGRLLKELELGDEKDLHDLAVSGDARFASPGHAKGNLAVSNGQLEVADDGNAYLMRGTNPAIFYVVSPGGEVVRQFIVDPGESASSYRPSAMHIYKNRIAILFIEPQSNEKIMKIVDLEGHELATYDEPAPDSKKGIYRLGATFACYTENPRQFTFLGASDDQKVQIVVAEPR